MRKLKLDLDELRVDTFTADERTPDVGTVRGNMPFEMAPTDETDDGGSGPATDFQTCVCSMQPRGCYYTCGIAFCSESCWTDGLNC